MNIQKISNKETWYGRTFTVLSILWGMLIIAALLQDEGVLPVLSVITFIVGGIWIGRGCSKYQPTNKIVHWLDLYITRVIDSICFLFGSIIASLIIFCIAGGSGIAITLMVWFEAYCVITLVIGWIITGKFIKQNLIAEANIKAKEMYEGKKRAIPYDNRKSSK